MRKMKKVLSLAMTAAMTASLLTGMGAVTASAKKSDDGKRTKITALLKGTESTEQYKTFDYSTFLFNELVPQIEKYS